MKRSTLLALFVVSNALAGCGSQDGAGESGGTDAANEAALDGPGDDVFDSSLEDASGDAGPEASSDAASEASEDASDGETDGSSDAPPDGPIDAPVDGPIDAAVDGPVDAPMDTAFDSPVDAPMDGPSDALVDGPWDAPSDVPIDVPDATDSSTGDGEVWIEIDYGSAYTSQSPGWSYSATPGWGEAQWAPPGWSYPEAWDRFNNMTVEWDPMGSKALMIGSSSQLQLMIGLEALLSYSSATVRLEGRSYSTSSSVSFEVSNPINGCAVSGSMSNDWTIHVVDLDFGQCLVAGTGLQAVRVDTLSGTLALVRMRVTLHDASW